MLLPQSALVTHTTCGVTGVRHVLVSKWQNALPPHSGGGVQSPPTSTHSLVSGQHTWLASHALGLVLHDTMLALLDSGVRHFLASGQQYWLARHAGGGVLSAAMPRAMRVLVSGSVETVEPGSLLAGSAFCHCSSDDLHSVMVPAEVKYELLRMYLEDAHTDTQSHNHTHTFKALWTHTIDNHSIYVRCP